jgi:hypothetical protein
MKKKIKIAAIAGMAVTILLIGGTSKAITNAGQIPEDVDLNSEWAKERMELIKDKAWMIKPEYSVIEGEIDQSAFVWEGDNLTFTQTQKEQLYNIISSWYEEKFEKNKGLKLENFEGMPTASFDTKLVECDGKEMILVTFQTPTMLEPRFEGDSLFKDDTIQTLVNNNSDEYEIYQAWYETEHKYTGVFSSQDFIDKGLKNK